MTASLKHSRYTPSFLYPKGFSCEHYRYVLLVKKHMINCGIKKPFLYLGFENECEFILIMIIIINRHFLHVEKNLSNYYYNLVTMIWLLSTNALSIYSRIFYLQFVLFCCFSYKTYTLQLVVLI